MIFYPRHLSIPIITLPLYLYLTSFVQLPVYYKSMNDKISNGSVSKNVRLQVEAYGLLRFLSVVEDSSITVGDLKKSLEKEIKDLYNWDAQVSWIKDNRQNDLNSKLRIQDILVDMDQIYIFLSFQSSKILLS